MLIKNLPVSWKSLSLLFLIGILISGNSTAQWLASNTGMGNQSVGALFADNDTLYAGTTFNLFKSTNEGNNWVSSNNGLSPVVNFYSIIRSGNFIIGGGDSPGIWQSSDFGANWIHITSGVDSDEYVLSFYDDGSTLFAAIGYPSAIGISTDNGTTWVKSTNNISSSQSMTGITRLGSLLFATHSALGVYVSSDNGATWSLMPAGIGAQDKNAIVTSGSNLCVGATNGVWLSTDAGSTWTHPLTSDIISGLTTRGNEVFAVGTLPYKSSDNGITWDQVDDNGLPGSIWNTMQFTTNYALVNYLGVGVYRRPISDVTGIEGDQTINSELKFKLEQNYPNPFNPATAIRYSVPQNSHVTLRVYDLLGKEITTLVNEEKPAGNYKVKFDAAGLVSGIYFYRLSVGNYSNTKKLILMK